MAGFSPVSAERISPNRVESSRREEEHLFAGRYSVAESLGARGVTRVFRAVDRFAAAEVLLKLWRPAAAQQASLLAMLRRQSRHAGRLSHANLADVRGAGVSFGHPYLVREFLPGPSLAGELAAQSRISIVAALEAMRDVCLGLGYLHSRGICHGALSATNVVRGESGWKLVDFDLTTYGFTASGGPRQGHDSSPSTLLPEDDLRAAEELLLDLLGIWRFAGDRWETAAEGKAVWRDSRMTAGVPGPVAAIVAKCLQADGSRSFGSAFELVAAISEARAAFRRNGRRPLSVRPPESRPTLQPASSARPGYRPFRSLARIVGGCALVLVASAWFYQRYTGRAAVLESPPIPTPETSNARPPVSLASVTRTGYPSRVKTPLGVMVLVPEGEFSAGAPAKDHTPPQGAYLGAFYIDETEVTNGQYLWFCNATGRPLPRLPSWDSEYFKCRECPVIDIGYDAAAAFAEWAGKRLPRDLEWEKAARGLDGRRYPWGTIFSKGLANWQEATTPAGRPQAVGSNPFDRSPFGALDMAGNVREWVAGESVPWHPNAPLASVRGGGFDTPPRALWRRDLAPRVPPDPANSSIGFRCASDPADAMDLSRGQWNGGQRNLEADE